MKKIITGGLAVFFLGALFIPFLSVESATFNVNGETVDVEMTDETKKEINEKKEEAKKNIEQKKEEVQERVRDAQCNTLVSRKEISLNRIENRMRTAETRIDVRSDSYEQRASQNDMAYEQQKERSEQARNSVYGEMMEIAVTQEEKDAVEAFESSVERSADKKYNSIDEARKEYREAQTVVIEAYQDSLLKPYEDYYDSVDSAMSSAIASCTGGKEMTTVRTTLRTDLSDAQSEFKQEMMTTKSSLRMDMSDAQNTYRTEVTDANQTYRLEVGTALDELEQVLDIDSITITIEL